MMCVIYSNGNNNQSTSSLQENRHGWNEPTARKTYLNVTVGGHNAMDYWYVVYLIKEMYKQSINM
jgi:hypothetical protein